MIRQDAVRRFGESGIGEFFVDLDRFERSAEFLAQPCESLAGTHGVLDESQRQNARAVMLDFLVGRLQFLRRRRATRARRDLVMAKGSDGCDKTGARTGALSIMARAKLPVKHMPIAPTPRPPHSAWAWRASARNQSTIGLDSFAASTRNSLLMQDLAMTRSA